MHSQTPYERPAYGDQDAARPTDSDLENDYKRRSAWLRGGRIETKTSAAHVLYSETGCHSSQSLETGTRMP